eukprot:CAMPEP_0115044584 /NCGR_PEP_ID=MMETSP0216-20121206/47599_1 /TAXON_ID=223996 /ORGANISM="Protocruzia adherens, Strain Boccale" /LENGTH=945 /DNA_ID=CAMNT_0002427219 /DNA_START=42 /DNA_END=2879 /DNA_ORIENTATION=+
MSGGPSGGAGGMDLDFGDFGIEPRAYEEIERGFQQVLNDLVGDKSLDRFREEYQKLHRALKISHENEKKLLKRVKELNNEIMGNAIQVKTALRLSQEDNHTIATLKKELEKVWKLVETSKDKEERNKQVIQNLKLEITSLARVIDQGSGLSIGQDNTVNQLLRVKDDLLKERDSLNTRIQALQGEHGQLIEKQAKLEQEKENFESEVRSLREEIQKNNRDAQREENRKKKFEERLDDVREKLDQKSMEAKAKDDEIKRLNVEKSDLQKKIEELKQHEKNQQEEIAASKKNYDTLEYQLMSQKEYYQKVYNQKSTLELHLKKKHDELNDAQKELQSLKKKHDELNDAQKELQSLKKKHDELNDAQKELQSLKKKHDELNDAQKELQSLKKKHDELNDAQKELQSLKKSLDRKVKENEKLSLERDEIKKNKDLAKAAIHHLSKDIEILRKESESDKKTISDLLFERNHIQTSIMDVDTKTKHQEEVVKTHETHRQQLDNKIKTQKDTIALLQRQIYNLEKDKEKYGIEASQANARHMQCLEEVKLKNNLISELQKKNAEAEQKIKNQTSLYEAVRSDRNLYSKNLIEAQDEIAEFKRRFKIMLHQITQLKEEIAAKDKALIAEHVEHKRQRKNNDSLKSQIEGLEKDMKSTEELIKSQETQISKLKYIIHETELERQNQKKEYESLLNERDILGTQLIRRNDELALLYEKIKIQQSTLAKGEIQYQERIGDIRLLKFKIADYKRELDIYKKQVNTIPDLKKQIYHLNKKLLQEQTKVKALSEELENPMNVHRWRKLEGTDPDTYEMITKIQTLQKRLIAKTEEVVEKDVIIQEKEKLYVELKNILARQPGPEVAEQLSIYQQNLKEKTRQMKAMASELNMYQAIVNEYKYEIERLSREMQELKRKYFEQKKREQAAKEAQQEKTKTLVNPAHVPTQRFTGGGFNLAI